ncbi:hypothetical protein [Pseudomonas alliivorans]|uniref:hypothetical protein n=1 Tax=Pseudomonas alliivorans TaxID=2810613 RepID=UPI00403AE1E8
MSEIKERPILFSAPMVRAILSGQKTVTRREVKKPAALDCLAAGFEPAFLALPGNADLCPYGKPGDRLWVREAFGLQVRHYGGGTGEHIVYRASNPDAIYCKSAEGREYPVKWKPSIHMPRHSCRILLEITDVRVERLQDISRSDIRTEGLECPPELASDDVSPNYRDWYPAAWRDLWQSINGAESWNANPWVWVVEFKRL